MRSYRAASSDQNRGPVKEKTERRNKDRSCVWNPLHLIHLALRYKSVKSGPTPEYSGPSSPTAQPAKIAMVVPEAIIEATEKGMVGENLLCSSIPSMEKSTSTTSPSKSHVMTRAEEACKSPPKSAAELDGHVKIKGVDV
ncbi:hypothetical protein E8E11_002416 [Didymella keratinophila]|nr:hypothetical protein E8E11_002416 [Didymella keratinophila]